MYECNGKEIARLTKLLSKELDFRIQFDSRPCHIHFTIRVNNKDISGFELVEMINCCGIFVSTHTFVEPAFRGQGFAQAMMPIKEAFAKELGYSLLMATVNITDNPAEVHILEKFGWKLNTSFVNSRTTHTVGIYTKEIK